MATLTVLVLMTSLWTGYGKIEPIPMPDMLQDCFTRYSMKTNIVETVGESIASFCVDQYIWRAAKQHAWRGFNVTKDAYEWAHSLLRRSDIQRSKRQTITTNNLRVRREYRRISDQERAAFHRAIQLLKADTSILPNRYDALSAIHQGIVTTSAHGGPNFLAFHRVYILMFENALREKVPTVTLPYWDSTMDEHLPDPTMSIVFTETFLGTGRGLVNSGPFAHWTTLSGPLTRNIGHSGQLFKAQDISRILGSVRLAEITEPLAPVNTSLEFLHNQVHIWIDGQMGSLNTAAHDPIFWLHHSYVDYVWEIFRRNQRNFGIDPSRDYPMPVNDSMHMPGMAMGISNFRNIDGFSDVFTSRMYTYEPSPTCSQIFPDCGSPYLRCMFVGFQSVCVSQDWFAAPRAAPIFRMFTQPPTSPAFNIMRTRQMMQGIAARMRQGFTQGMSRGMFPVPQQRLPQQFFTGQSSQEGRGEMEGGIDDLSESQSAGRKRRSNDNNAAFQHMNKQNMHVDMSMNSARGHIEKRQAPDQAFMMSGFPGQQTPAFATCPNVPVATAGYQNTFNINGRSDIHHWVYVPVKIVYQRPPTYSMYASYPVVNGEADEEMDIYAPARYKNVNTLLQTGKPASYSHCGSTSGAGKVYVASQGINYIGTYKEYAIVDHRLAISIATAYVAVKSPTKGLTDVYLSAYDECGRVCTLFCRPSPNSQFRRCPGTFRLNSENPKMYGTNFGESVSNLWNLAPGNDQCPIMSNEVINVQFHCNFKEYWPFSTQGQSQPQTKIAAGEQKVEQETGGEGGMEAASSEEKGPEVGNEGGVCNIGHGCFINGGCRKCANGQRYACVRTCADYATCHNGDYYIQRCPDNTWFDEDEQQCRQGSCFQKYREFNTWQLAVKGKK